MIKINHHRVSEFLVFMGCAIVVSLDKFHLAVPYGPFNTLLDLVCCSFLFDFLRQGSSDLSASAFRVLGSQVTKARWFINALLRIHTHTHLQVGWKLTSARDLPVSPPPHKYHARYVGAGTQTSGPYVGIASIS